MNKGAPSTTLPPQIVRFSGENVNFCTTLPGRSGVKSCHENVNNWGNMPRYRHRSGYPMTRMWLEAAYQLGKEKGEQS